MFFTVFALIAICLQAKEEGSQEMEEYSTDR